MYWEPRVVEPVKAKPRIEGGAGGAGAAGVWAIRGAVRTVVRESRQSLCTRDSREGGDVFAWGKLVEPGRR